MIIESIYWVISIIACIAVLVRLGLFSRIMAEFLAQRIHDKISSLKVSAPNLTSTFDSKSSTSL